MLDLNQLRYIGVSLEANSKVVRDIHTAHWDDANVLQVPLFEDCHAGRCSTKVDHCHTAFDLPLIQHCLSRP